MRGLINEIVELPAIVCNQCPEVFLGIRFQPYADLAEAAKDEGWKPDNPFGALCPDCIPYTEEELKEP